LGTVGDVTAGRAGAGALLGAGAGALGWEAAGAGAGAPLGAGALAGAAADVTADGVAVDSVEVAACAGRENNSKTTKMPTAKIATCTARRAMCRSTGWDISSSRSSGEAG
jgi:hypothetical protein